MTRIEAPPSSMQIEALLKGLTGEQAIERQQFILYIDWCLEYPFAFRFYPTRSVTIYGSIASTHIIR